MWATGFWPHVRPRVDDLRATDSSHPRDPRTFGGAATTSVVTRKDENNGSNFMQELAPNAYPVISQALKLRHDN